MAAKLLVHTAFNKLYLNNLMVLSANASQMPNNVDPGTTYRLRLIVRNADSQTIVFYHHIYIAVVPNSKISGITIVKSATDLNPANVPYYFDKFDLWSRAQKTLELWFRYTGNSSVNVGELAWNIGAYAIEDRIWNTWADYYAPI